MHAEINAVFDEDCRLFAPRRITPASMAPAAAGQVKNLK
jgi:hypothetical protein